ncbi:MAG: M20/M25/M40 family metallo-hydrolase, partial [Pyramidobacter sp.]|nr:M20/M25/M40 family metallo-hydrolase [Pyramidobacter sp.]
RALAMMLSLLRGLNACGVKTCGDVYFVATTREEGTGALGGMKDFLDEHPEIEISLDIDSNDAGRIIFEATLCQTWEFTYKGQGGHANSAFGKIAQPVHAAARAVAKIAALEVPAQPKTTFAVTNFHAGNISGVHAIASEASFIVNFRSNGADEFEAVKKFVFDAVKTAAREESARWGKNEIEVSSRCLCDIPGGAQDAHSPLVEAAWLSLSAVGVEPWLEQGGSTNANIAIAKGIPALCMGRAWAPDEDTKRNYNHSLDERLYIVGAYKPVQHIAQMLLMAAGLDGEFASIVK